MVVRSMHACTQVSSLLILRHNPHLHSLQKTKRKGTGKKKNKGQSSPLTQNNQLLKLPRPQQFPNENFQRHRHAGDVLVVVGLGSELHLLLLGQEVVLVDVDAQGARDGLGGALEGWVCEVRWLLVWV